MKQERVNWASLKIVKRARTIMSIKQIIHDKGVIKLGILMLPSTLTALWEYTVDVVVLHITEWVGFVVHHDFRENSLLKEKQTTIRFIMPILIKLLIDHTHVNNLSLNLKIDVINCYFSVEPWMEGIQLCYEANICLLTGQPAKSILVHIEIFNNIF